ncbi:MAG: lecithin retinol acyltransferase family protein [Dolichospermum sp. DET50]|nr:lecithin retinol acyltransferase family protein [Dolichospermum sp. DET66]MBS3033629.1 lecithin retinol acyltransferase family protein [Dolichospermum sp. DET67]MBS3038831.1 lecithin retinol acyltransferase family protein [Dolichospermum sp. DET50]QSX66097.1 MAG: lecithin retinol acyltransferase family protein [Dolichospermum sp. DET69]
MAEGDHIFASFYFNGLPITHHGIDCGNGTVIHYDGSKVCKVSKTEFAKGTKIRIKEYGQCDPDYLVVHRAEQRLYERNYNLFSNNCEHFAYYCKTGKHKSEQVNHIAAAGAEAVSGAFVGFAAKEVTKAAATAAVSSLNPISKALVNVGLKQAPKVVGRGAAGIAGAGGLVSGVVTDLIVGKILEDNEHLPHHKREARKKARQAGQVASVAGGIAGTVAAAAVGGTAAIAISAAAPAVLGIGIALGSYQLFKDSQK